MGVVEVGRPGTTWDLLESNNREHQGPAMASQARERYLKSVIKLPGPSQDSSLCGKTQIISAASVQSSISST